MEITLIEELLIMFAPAVTALAGIIATCVKIVRSVKTKFDEAKAMIIAQNKVLKEQHDQFVAVCKDNEALRAKMNEVLTAIDHVSREE